MSASPVENDGRSAVAKFSFKTRASKPKNKDFASRISDLKKRYPKIISRLAE
jgi:hypothetical protein